MDATASSSTDARRTADAPARSLDAPGPNVGSGGRNNVVVKVGMVGDAQVGKTSLMVKYVEGKFDEDYIHTLGTSQQRTSLLTTRRCMLYALIDTHTHACVCMCSQA